MSAIEARGLVKRFGKTTAVDDVSFTVEAGEVFGLLGPNGAGKTTTFGMLCGWLRADAGHATVLGQPCSAIHRLRGRATALPQDATFAPDLSLVRQLRHYALLSGVAPEAADRAAMEALERVGLADAAGKKGDELSHGMAKRAGIAQAFVGNAEVVFLDEPTAGLDPLNAKQVREIIASQRGERTVIVSSHNLAEVEDVCTHGLILDHGQVRASGPMAQLTQASTDVRVETHEGVTPPLDALSRAFGASQVRWEADEAALYVTRTSERDEDAHMAEVLRVLLGAEFPIVSVARGRSLESTFLDLTGDTP